MALLKGTLDALVLKALTAGPRHGFEIIRWIEDGSAGEIRIESAALLQSLQRLEERGHVTADWGTTENNRRARYYTITAAGRIQLRQETAALATSVAALAGLLGFPAPSGGGRR
ncbi:MAG: PadR family transcriptional regulator [Gemmatimonadales bacterium]